MTFSDPERHRRWIDPHGAHALNIEIGRESTRSGQIVTVVGPSSPRAARAVLERAFDIAGSERQRTVWSPGWWTGIVFMAAREFGPASVQRLPVPTRCHALLRTESGRIVCDWPDWPMARLSPSGPWLDLRGETALDRGPGETDMRAWAGRLAAGGIETSLDAVAAGFGAGVLEWAPGEIRPGERRRLQRAT